MKTDNFSYNKHLKPLAQDMRNHSTEAEVRLWCELLRNKQMRGFSFNRQRPIDNYIADFFCKPLKLVVEIDGGVHDNEDIAKRDAERQKRLEELGYKVLRFTNEAVMRDLENVRRELEAFMDGMER